MLRAPVHAHVHMARPDVDGSLFTDVVMIGLADSNLVMFGRIGCCTR